MSTGIAISTREFPGGAPGTRNRYPGRHRHSSVPVPLGASCVLASNKTPVPAFFSFISVQTAQRNLLRSFFIPESSGLQHSRPRYGKSSRNHGIHAAIRACRALELRDETTTSGVRLPTPLSYTRTVVYSTRTMSPPIQGDTRSNHPPHRHFRYISSSIQIAMADTTA